MTAPKAIRRYRRFKGWDYTKGASLFITIATEPRRPLFGEIKGGRVVLTPLGEKVAEALEAMPRLNPGLRLFGWVVMPDHVHFNCALVAGLEEPLKVFVLGLARGRDTGGNRRRREAHGERGGEGLCDHKRLHLEGGAGGARHARQAQGREVHSHSALLHTEPPLQAGERLHRAFCGEPLPRDRARQRRD